MTSRLTIPRLLRIDPAVPKHRRRRERLWRETQPAHVAAWAAAGLVTTFVVLLLLPL